MAKMITKAFLQEQGNGKLRHEEQLVFSCLQHEMPITLFTAKRIRRRQLPLDHQSLIVGDMDCVYGAMKQLGLEIPTPNTYPKSLQKYLYRKTWKSNLRQLQANLMAGTQVPVFAKPGGSQKRFTGRVFITESDLYYIGNTSKNEEIHCSEVVTWLSEYRVYVVNSQIKSIDFYAGDSSIEIDKDVVQEAIDKLDLHLESYAGYGIDFGVLDNGKTALVEMNDGFSIGAYEIDAKVYTEMILARWEQLLAMCS